MQLTEYLGKHPKKHLIFDFDETIFTLLLPWEIYIRELTQKLILLDPTLKQFSHGKLLNAVENEAVLRHGTPALQIRREYSLFFEKNYYQGVEEHQEITQFIRENHQNYQCYIWTSNMYETVAPILEQHTLLNCFKKIITKSDVILTKPEPEGFYLIFDPETQQKQDYLMIGDSSNDRGAAQKAEIDFWLVEHNSH